jgi:hypothetical protein
VSLVGFLDNFSLAEIFQIINSGCKSGKLLIRPSPVGSNSIKGSYYLWFEHGHLVTVTNNLTNTNFLYYLENHGLLKQPDFKNKIDRLCSTLEPVGSCLHRHGSLSQEQLQSIFQSQLKQAYQLFEIPFGWYKFEDVTSDNDLPWTEMTGESIGGIEVALNGLRQLDNWNHLASALPESNSTLEQLVTQHKFKLEPLEFKLWKFADGETTLKQFAESFDRPIIDIQRAAYGLIVAGLVEALPVFDVPVRSNSTSKNQIAPEPKLVSVESQSTNTQPVRASKSLLGNLLDFLGNF